jgi:hypothetical protein
MSLEVQCKPLLTSTRIIPEAPVLGPNVHFEFGLSTDLHFSGAITPLPIVTSQIAVRAQSLAAGTHLILSIYQVPGGQAAGIANLLGTADITLVDGGPEDNFLGTFSSQLHIEAGLYFLAFGFAGGGVSGLIRIMEFFDIFNFSDFACSSTHPMTFTNGSATAPPATVNITTETQNTVRSIPSAWLI